MSNLYVSIIKLDPFEYISDEECIQILSYLAFKHLVQCSRVSKLWYRLTTDNSLWKKLFSEIEFPKNMDAVDYINCCLVSSRYQIVEKFREFINTVKFNQIASFKCLFPFNPDNYLEIIFGYGIGDINLVFNKMHQDNIFKDKPDLKTICIFVKQLTGNSSHLSIESSPGRFGNDNNILYSYLKYCINIKSFNGYSNELDLFFLDVDIRNLFDDRIKGLIE